MVAKFNRAKVVSLKVVLQDTIIHKPYNTALDNSEYYNQLSNEQYRTITGTEKSIEVSPTDTGRIDKGRGVNRPDVESSQPENKGYGLAGSEGKVTELSEEDAAINDFMDAFYEENTFNLHKV